MDVDNRLVRISPQPVEVGDKRYRLEVPKEVDYFIGDAIYFNYPNTVGGKQYPCKYRIFIMACPQDSLSIEIIRIEGIFYWAVNNEMERLLRENLFSN